MPELDIAGVVRTLNAAGVRYVVIGGVAALVHDLPLPATVDIDVTPSRDPGNLERLADAFEALEAGLLTAEDPGTWFPRRPVENWARIGNNRGGVNSWAGFDRMHGICVSVDACRRQTEGKTRGSRGSFAHVPCSFRGRRRLW
ncbi:MAG: hypothetical protein ACRDY7_07805 [Acidimicrobiia bacterium]